MTPFTTSSTVADEAAPSPIGFGRIPPESKSDHGVDCALPTPSMSTARNSSFLVAHSVPQAQLMKIAVALLQGVAVSTHNTKADVILMLGTRG